MDGHRGWSGTLQVDGAGYRTWHTWPDSAVTWSFADTHVAGDWRQGELGESFQGAHREILRDAFDAWEAVCGIDFQEVSDGASVQIRVGWSGAGSQWLNDGPGGFLGYYRYRYDGNGDVERGVLLLDPADRDGFLGDDEAVYDVALHEVGHALGLDHSDVRNVVMSGGEASPYWGGVAGRNPLQTDDIAGAIALWGRPQGTAGADTLRGGPDADTLIGLGGPDVLLGGGGADTLFGGAGDDRAWGQDGPDVLLGGEGADTLFGGAGDDRAWGQDGNDFLDGGDGDDHTFGMEGDDSLSGGEGRRSGNDTLQGGSGDDTILGFDGDDALWGEAGNDVLGGGAGIDVLGGGPGDDTLDGGAGAGDYVWGGAGNDALTGGAGRDVLVGGGGADRLAGGVEGDTFFGHGVAGADTSSDTFVVTGGRSWLMDFQPGTDRIELSGTTEAALRGSAVQLDDHLLLTGAGGEQIYLAWTAVAEINGVDLLL